MGRQGWQEADQQELGLEEETKPRVMVRVGVEVPGWPTAGTAIAMKGAAFRNSVLNIRLRGLLEVQAAVLIQQPDV